MEYNEADRIVEGFGNVSIIDNQGDFVSTTRISELMPTYMRRGGILMDSHTNRHIGNIIHWELREKDGKDAVYLWAKIFNDYSIDDMVWKAIGNKHYTGFSFGGRSVDKDVKCTDGVCFNNIKDLEIWEWSIVPKPANKESIFTKFNEIAKGDKMNTVLVPRVEDGSVIYDQVEMVVDNGMMYKSDTSTEAEKMDDYQSPEVQEEEKMDEINEMEKAGGPGSRGPSSREMGYRRKDYEPTERTKDVRAKKETSGEEEKMDGTQEVAKEDSPMTAPAEDAGNPMNKILSILESIDGRLTALEGGNEEKAELEDMPPE
ncbi:MAG: HK97 family phage prohead protease, partial [Gammaproteobacteria bacterium]|nr:HK97 family phage prohead protease [Gammaproteobacteria bacterium]